MPGVGSPPAVRPGLKFPHLRASTTTIKPFVSFGGNSAVHVAHDVTAGGHVTHDVTAAHGGVPAVVSGGANFAHVVSGSSFSWEFEENLLNDNYQRRFFSNWS